MRRERSGLKRRYPVNASNNCHKEGHLARDCTEPLLCRRCGQPGWVFFLSFTADILPQCAPTRFSASAACSWATWRRTAPTQRFATSATRAAILATIARTEASCVFVTNTRLHAQNSGGGSHSHDAHAQNHKQQIDVPAGLGLGGQDAHVKQRRQDEGHDGDGEAAECRQGARGEEKGY